MQGGMDGMGWMGGDTAMLLASGRGRKDPAVVVLAL